MLRGSSSAQRELDERLKAMVVQASRFEGYNELDHVCTIWQRLPSSISLLPSTSPPSPSGFANAADRRDAVGLSQQKLYRRAVWV